MIVDTEKYHEFTNTFADISQTYIDQKVLNTLKDDYKKTINSEREIEKINNVKSLLLVLEKRGLLRYNKIEIVKIIAQTYIKNESINKLISDYEQWLQNNCTKINNLYKNSIVLKVENANPPVNQSESKMHQQTVTGVVSGPVTINQIQFCYTQRSENKDLELQNLVLNKLAVQIDKHWIDVSRQLNLREIDIQEIETKYFHEPRCYEKMFKKALRMYFSTNPNNWRSKLTEALDKCRRRDLKIIVQDLLDEFDS